MNNKEYIEISSRLKESIKQKCEYFGIPFDESKVLLVKGESKLPDDVEGFYLTVEHKGSKYMARYIYNQEYIKFPPEEQDEYD